LSSYYASSLVAVFMSALLAGIALLAHHVYRSQSIKRQLKEEQQKRTEAELEWLKNQLNPHFLFNTLNNISSLVQIDADKAQDAIAQLSDLLRYAMYETRRETVPLQGEVEFMRNYIALMKLRCSEKTVVNCQFSIANSPLTIAPLLFISLIENAFKHGVSNNRDSMVCINMDTDGRQLTFSCRNTNYPKDEQNRSGSGIGLENTRRRLQLLYPNRYTWQQGIDDQNIYYVQITIQL
jgi:LytS/YehU family sensor histidine kinase